MTQETAPAASWRALFSTPKPVLAMLHLGGEDQAERLSRARRETAVLVDGGVDAVIVENYFGDVDDVRRVLDALSNGAVPPVIGLNVLRDTERAFALADEFPVAFVQIDSVAGHLAPDDDAEYAERLAERRAASRALVFGGVRFKYQPVNSGRPEAEDLALGAQRSDAIVVTGDGTGVETALSKIERFREALGPSYPLIVGAGVTDENAAAQLLHADAAIVGSFFKDSYRDTGVVDADHVARFMTAVARVRSGL
ncbi:BtpA/SgcQ family protein [Microterricola gilva]|nr:BtpA/SgcQ family protein [Microterricola gilva]